MKVGINCGPVAGVVLGKCRSFIFLSVSAIFILSSVVCVEEHMSRAREGQMSRVRGTRVKRERKKY